MSERFFKRLDEIDKITAGEPSVHAARALRELVLELSSEVYLFNSIGAQWLTALQRSGWFRNPPEPQRDTSGTHLVRWPAADFLVRAIKRAKENRDSRLPILMKQIISDIPVVRNPFIFKNIIDVMLEMPIADVADLSLVLQSWLGQQSAVWTQGVPQLIGRLVEAGFRTASFRLIRAQFAILPDTKFYSQPKELVLLPEPKALLRDWEYEQQLSEVLRTFDGRAELGLIIILTGLLHDAVRFSQKDLAYQGPADTSFVWRPAVEDHEQNRLSRTKGVLVQALRQACEEFLKHEPDRLRELVEVLQAQQWFIFARIVMHLLRIGVPNVPEITEYLTNRSYFDEVTVRHEYALLLKAHFGKLTKDAQQQILGFIEEGPDTFSYVRGYKQWAGKEPDQAQIDKYIGHWQTEWLAFIQDYLAGEWRTRMNSLSAVHVRSPHPEFPSYMESGWSGGPRSPISSEELGNKTPEQVIAYIRNWSPSPRNEGEGWPDDAETMSGLADALSATVLTKAEEMSAVAEQFIGFDPTYVRGFLEGIYNAARQQKSIDWKSVIALCRWASSEQGLTDAGNSFHERDTGWLWTKQTITRVLQEALNEGANAVPLDLRISVWETINLLLLSPDALQGEEAQEPSSDFDPLTRSLNTVAGSALHAAFKYALWVRRHDKSFVGVSTISDFSAALEYVLAHPSTYGLTSRAVIGQWFPWLVLIDTEWSKTLVDIVFPESEKDSHLWEAAWNTYVGFCAPYDQPFELLRKKYAFAITYLNRESRFHAKQYEPDQRLGEHLLSFYWRGRLGLEADGLIKRYFQNCDIPAFQHSLEFIGRSIGGHPDVQQDVIERLKLLFDSLLNDVKNGKLNPSSLIPFGSWFAGERLDEQWRMSRLLEVLRLTSRVDPADAVLEHLRRLAEKFPLEAAEAVYLIGKGNYELWDFDYWSPKAFAVLETAVASGREDVRSLAAEAAEKFAVSGRLEFRAFAVIRS